MTLRIGTWKNLSFTLLACSAIACGTERIIGQGELETGGSIGVGGEPGTEAGGALATGGVSNTTVQQQTGGAMTTGGAVATGGAVNVVGGTAPIGSTTSTLPCYAPSADLSLDVYTSGAKGCACDSTKEADVCVNGVALICSGGTWRAVLDGPCGLTPPAYFSPSSCTAAGGIPLASPGGPLTPETDCPSGVSLGVITTELSGWDEGGLCCAPTEYNKACGGWAGNTCSQAEYCAYEEGGNCGLTDGQSVCKPRPSACDVVYTPVCACNQKTYGNACYAALAGYGVLHAGECQ